MVRWLAFGLLLGCSGCMLLDDPMPYEHEIPSWSMQSTTEPPMGSCMQPVGHVNVSQTQEPELLQAR